MTYFIIGSYENQQNQIYCTVVALCNDLTEATLIQKKLKEGNMFVPHGITEETKKEIEKMMEYADLWNQVGIVKLTDFR